MSGLQSFILLLVALLILDFSVRDVPFNVRNLTLRRILDNSGHFLTAAILWATVRLIHGFSLSDRLVTLESFTCGLLASIIDIDHAFFIKSVAPNPLYLTYRPILHCSTLMLVIVLIFLLMSISSRLWWLHSLSFMCLISWSSHHLRDSLRRGLWFWPIGTTKSLNYQLYLVILVLIPPLTANLMNLTGTLILIARDGGRDKLHRKEINKIKSPSEDEDHLLSIYDDEDIV